MPILDLQRRLVEVGRLRMGNQVPYKKKDGTTGHRAAKLDKWRITSRDQQRLEAAAQLYGGEVKPWEEREGEYEVYTTTAELPILLLPGQALSQFYESWTGGGCTRRCDGDRELLTDAPCLCANEPGERTCKPTSRLSVMLPDVPGLGCWRLESHGYYAAVELAGTAGILERATAGGQPLPARLRIDQRSKVEGGKTTRWAVPVIDIDVSIRQALPEYAELPTAWTPLIQSTGVTVEQGLAAVAKEREERTGNGRQQAEIGPAGEIEFPDTPIPVLGEQLFGDVPELDVITDAQRRLLFAIATKGEIPEEELRTIILVVTGQESTKLIPAGAFDKVLERLQALLPEGQV